MLKRQNYFIFFFLHCLKWKCLKWNYRQVEQPSSIYFSVVATKPELDGKKGREQKKKAARTREESDQDGKSGQRRHASDKGGSWILYREAGGRETLFLLEEWFPSFLFDKPMQEECRGKNNALHHTGWGRRKRSVFSKSRRRLPSVSPSIFWGSM